MADQVVQVVRMSDDPLLKENIMVILPLLAGLLSGGAPIQTSGPLVAVRHDPLGGLPLCIWNDSALFTKLKKGMQEASTHVYRFPNGSTSNEYHWNHSGAYDIDSNWVPSDSIYLPGWRSETLHRGTSKNHYGFVRPSLIDDGDTSTYWWSNPDHPGSPGWFLFDLGTSKAIDSMALWLGDLRPDSVQVLRWTGANGPYPGPNQQATGWQEVARLPASDRVLAGFAAVTTRYLGVKPFGSALPKGWKVAECALFKSGTAVTTASKDGTAQTQVVAISSHPSSVDQSVASNWDFDTYMAWIQATPGAQPMVCVNYGTGTAREAAAWVKYANVRKGYGIHRWQVGNEVAGDWEEGGSVSARQYAQRFCQFAKAMKAVDPAIQVEGPVLPHAHFTDYASGDFDGRSWAEGYLMYVDSVEKADGIRLMDGFDFHSYPYWFGSVPDTEAMLAAIDDEGPRYDSLVALMGRTIADPTSREVLLTEYNTSTVNSSLEQEVSGGTGAGLQLAHFIQRFGDRGVAILWELFEGGSLGPDGTFGTLSMFNKPTQSEWSSLGYPPNAPFWPVRTILRDWLDTAGGDTVVKIDQPAGARAFAVRNHGRVSVIAFNLAGDSTPVQLDPASFVGGDLLSWGSGEYRWNGTSADAQAVPDNGPSSHGLPAGWDGAFKLPPWGFVVVRGAGRPLCAPRTGHLLLKQKKVSVSDSLGISGWATSSGTHLTGGTWTVGSHTGSLAATDGAWDGPMESWAARIAGADLGEGSWLLRLAIAGANGDTLRDSARFEITGSLRPVLLISNFDNKTMKTSWGSTWGSYSADGSTRLRSRLDTTKGLGSTYLRDSITMAQPSDLGYPVYAAAILPLPAGLDTTDTTRNLVGIVFDINTTHSSRSGSFKLLAFSTKVTDYDEFFTTLPNTAGAWVHDTILFDELHQEGWGVDVAPFDFADVTKMEFRMIGAGKTTLWLDNVSFLGTRGADYHVGTKPESARRPALKIAARELSVGVEGTWVVRLVAPSGRTLSRWEGNGARSLRLPRTVGPTWAVLESGRSRQILSIPPALR